MLEHLVTPSEFSSTYSKVENSCVSDERMIPTTVMTSSKCYRIFRETIIFGFLIFVVAFLVAEVSQSIGADANSEAIVLVDGRKSTSTGPWFLAPTVNSGLRTAREYKADEVKDLGQSDADTAENLATLRNSRPGSLAAKLRAVKSRPKSANHSQGALDTDRLTTRMSRRRPVHGQGHTMVTVEACSEASGSDE